MSKSLIFVSCGQLTEAEKTLGTLLKAVIDGTPGFEAYFAETVHDFEALARHVLDGLRRCAGAVFIFQDRGIVLRPDGGEWGRRSSVWVNQELAVLAYRQLVEARKIPVIAFADPNVRLEGAMTALIVNARPLGTAQDISNAVKAWLAEAHFAVAAEDAFVKKWVQLSEDARRVIAGLLDEGGYNVKETAVRHAVMRRFGVDSNRSSEVLRKAKQEFIKTDLVKLIHDLHSGDELCLHPTWELDVRRHTAKWLVAPEASG
jgi:hypothetical protein